MQLRQDRAFQPLFALCFCCSPGLPGFPVAVLRKKPKMKSLEANFTFLLHSLRSRIPLKAPRSTQHPAARTLPRAPRRFYLPYPGCGVTELSFQYHF